MRLVIGAVTVALIGVTPASAAGLPYDFSRRAVVSETASGVDGLGDSGAVALSPDGRYAAFVSTATNLVANDVNGIEPDVFLKDLRTGRIELVSRTPSGRTGNQRSFIAGFDAKNRKVLFTSFATDLVAGDTNQSPDGFWYDIRTRKVQRVTLGRNKVELNGPSIEVALSPNGRHLAFTSMAQNVLGNDGGTSDPKVYVRDLVTNKVWLASARNRAAAEGFSGGPVFSPDGRRLAFYSNGSNLAANLPPFVSQVYEVSTSDVTPNPLLISRTASGEPGSASSLNPVYAPAGRGIAFITEAPNLLPADAPPKVLQVVYKASPKATRLRVISRPTKGDAAGSANSWSVSFFDGGKAIAFDSFARNLVPDANGLSNVYVHHIRLGRTEAISRTPAGVLANGGGPAVAAKSKVIAFSTTSKDIVPDKLDAGTTSQVVSMHYKPARR